MAQVVERNVRDVEAASSSLVTPTKKESEYTDSFFVCEEGKQAAPKGTFVFTRAYTNKFISREATSSAKQKEFMSLRKENKHREAENKASFKMNKDLVTALSKAVNDNKDALAEDKSFQGSGNKYGLLDDILRLNRILHEDCNIDIINA